jgi:hypothetical protein
MGNFGLYELRSTAQGALLLDCLNSIYSSAKLQGVPKVIAGVWEVIQ